MSTVLCHGCFDILHIGHVLHFEEAREMGDSLIVTITADGYIKKEGRPIFNHWLRKKMIEALRIVDEVGIIFDESGAPGILTIQPAVYVKGVDYRDVGINAIEAAACKKVGARVAFTGSPKFSSSELVRYFR